MTDSPFGGLSAEELLKLKIDLQYAAQKAERAYVALNSQRCREKNLRVYTADQVKGGKVEIRHAEIMLRGAARDLLPVFEVLAASEVITP